MLFFYMGSGQTIIDDWFITCFNLVFTALPLGVQAVTDFDVLESDSEQVKRFMPFLYRESREIHPIFSLWRFTFNLFKGFAFAFVIFYLICFSDFGRIINTRGDYGTLWYMSLKTYTNIIFSVSITLFLRMRYITFLFPLIMFTSTFLLYIIFLMIVQYVTFFNSYGVIFNTLSSSQFYFSTFLFTSMSFLADYMIESISFNFGSGISCSLQRNNFGKKDALSDMSTLVKKRNMFSKIFQINSNLENKAISKLSDLSMSKTDNYIEDNRNQSPIIERTKSVVNVNTAKIYNNKRYSEAIGFYKQYITLRYTSFSYVLLTKNIVSPCPNEFFLILIVLPFRCLQTSGRIHKVACEKFIFHTSLPCKKLSQNHNHPGLILLLPMPLLCHQDP